MDQSSTDSHQTSQSHRPSRSRLRASLGAELQAAARHPRPPGALGPGHRRRAVGRHPRGAPGTGGGAGGGGGTAQRVHGGHGRARFGGVAGDALGWAAARRLLVRQVARCSLSSPPRGADSPCPPSSTAPSLVVPLIIRSRMLLFVCRLSWGLPLHSESHLPPDSFAESLAHTSCHPIICPHIHPPIRLSHPSLHPSLAFTGAGPRNGSRSRLRQAALDRRRTDTHPAEPCDRTALLTSWSWPQDTLGTQAQSGSGLKRYHTDCPEVIPH